MDSSTLRAVLSTTDGSGASIHKSAGAMMRLYDRATSTAVAEWRNVLQTSDKDQLLPLLYVANEVLQNSKRNRGSKFLEAFSPVLGQSLIYICSTCPSITETVRRTVKIWGDRSVYSVRFVGELLKGLEPYRNQEEKERPNFSPPAKLEKKQPTPVKKTTPKKETIVVDDSDDDSDDDDDLGFGDIPAGDGHLDLDLKIQSTTFSTPEPKKRVRRNSSFSQTKRRKTILSTSSLMELWTQVASLQDGLESSQSLLKEISSDSSQATEDLVGEELVQEYQKVLKAQDLVQKQGHALYKICNDRKSLQQEAQKYIPWLQAALETDADDLRFSQKLEGQLELVAHVHSAARVARDEKRSLEELERQRQEEERRKQQEEDERRKFMESALKRETEQKDDMVWSRERQEYVHLNTEESWRD